MMSVRRERREEDLEVMIEGWRIETVDSFKYLGSVFCREGGTEGDINERITKFGRCTNLFSPLLRDTAIPLGVKRTIYERILVPIIMYGAECWTMTVKTRSRVQAAEMRPLRVMLGKSRRDRMRNEHVRGRVGVSPLCSKIEKLQLG